MSYWKVVVFVFVQKAIHAESLHFTDNNHRVTVNVKCGRSKYVGLSLFSDTQKAIESLLQLTDVTRVLGSQVRTDLASKVLRFLKLPQRAGKATQV
jgi:hypothetical protein